MSTMFSVSPSEWRGHPRARHLLIGIFLVGVSASAAFGGIDPDTLAVSPDTTIKYGGELLADEGASAPGDPSQRVDFGPIPQGVEVTGFHILEDDTILFAVDQAVLLNGIFITPRDVAITDGNDYDVFYKGEGEGVPLGVGIDAVASEDGELFLSFDTTLELGGVVIDDEDLAIVTGSPAIIFDGSVEGVERGADLDAAHFIDSGTLALSFDISAKIGGFVVDDEDVLAWDGSFLAVVYDGSTVAPEWQAADLNGLFIGEGTPPPPVDVIFEDDFEAGNVSAWTLSVP